MSVKRLLCDKMEEKSVQIFISHERSFSLVFLRKRMQPHVVGDVFYSTFRNLFYINVTFYVFDFLKFFFERFLHLAQR